MTNNEIVVMTCRICGCTDEDCNQCIEATGVPCHWVANSLCSRCGCECGAVLRSKQEKEEGVCDDCRED